MIFMNQFANYNNSSEGSYVGFEITTNGNPKIYYQNYVNKNNKTTSSITFSDYDVRGKGMIKLAVICENVDGNGVYKLYVNGKFAGQGPAPAYHFRYNYNVIDLTPFLQKGENVIAVHTLYQGLINRVWQSGDGRHGLLLELEV